MIVTEIQACVPSPAQVACFQLKKRSLKNVIHNSCARRTGLRLHSTPRDREFEEFRDTESDPRYQRIDMSTEHAAEARAAFLAAISPGEGALDLAEGALQVAAEDDALVSHSSVGLPVGAFRSRMQRLAGEFERTKLPPLRAAGASDKEILSAAMMYLYEEQRFAPPAFGRTNLPLTATVDNPGVWENPRYAYLHEVLVTRRGTPAALAILLSDLLRRLLLSGAIDFAAKINFTSDMSKAPTAELIPGVTRAQAVTQAPETPHQSENNTNSPNTTTSTTTSSSSSSGTLGVLTLNTCTSDALVECLRYLKRSYWPFQWDPMAGGFRGAAKAYLDGADSAEAEAIARTARHRLERGIWTSPGGGDLRRAIAAAERLVILRGEEASEERRDLAVLYCHAGRLPEAKAELKARAKAVAGRSAAGGGGARRPPVISLSPDTGVSVAASFDELPDAVLEDRLLALLCQVPMGQGGAVAPLSVEEGMRRAQAKGGGEGTVMPLTW